MTVVHPIARALISTGGTGARNYDEFADDAEITDIVAANPDSALGIEMPHRAPDSLGKSFTEALPDAVERLRRQRADGRYAPAEQVVALYRIDDSYGLFAMVDTAEISTSADEPGRVIRNEDVFLEKVRERVALAEATGHLLSPVLLLQTGSELDKALRAAVESAGAPAVTDVDHVGRTHAVWPVTGEAAAELAALAGQGELVVADGNHRSLAAQTGGLPRFLAVITTPASVAIQPYHRLVSDPPVPLPVLVNRLSAAGATVVEGVPEIPPAGRSSFMDRAARTRSGSPASTATRSSTGWTTPWSSSCSSATRWGWSPATSGSPTSVATIRPTGCAERSTPAGPTWPS